MAFAAVQGFLMVFLSSCFWLNKRARNLPPGVRTNVNDAYAYE